MSKKPEPTRLPPLAIPLPFVDAVRGLMAVDPKQLPSKASKPTPKKKANTTTKKPTPKGGKKG